tara:strand:+ start:2509 stop:3654 length:1146 start_codon:yes stop_codon:yes gene_type:complete
MTFQKIKDLISIGTGDIFGTVATAIFWFYLASQIKPSEYGEIHWLLGMAAIFSQVALFGTLNTLTVYTAKNVKIQSTFYFISLLGSFVLSLVIIIIIPGFYKIDSGLLLIGYVINTLALGDLLGRKLYSSYSRYVLTQKGLSLILGLSFFYLFGYESILFALALSYSFYLKRIIQCFKEFRIDLTLIKPRIGFITNNYVIMIVQVVNGQVDKIIITYLVGFSVLGNYSLGIQFITVMMMFSTIIFRYLLPQDSSGTSNKQLKLLVILVSIGISIIGIIFIPSLASIFFPEFLELEAAIPILSLYLIPATLSLLFESKFLGAEKSKIVLLGTVISVASYSIGMLTLGPIYGIIGFSASLIISISLKTIFFGIIFKFYPTNTK